MARDAFVKKVLARAAEDEEGATVAEILARAENAETVYPRPAARRVVVREGALWGMVGH